MDLDAFKNKRKNAKATITRIKNYVDSNKDLDVHEYIVREEALNLAYEKFCEAMDDLEINEQNVDHAQQRDEMESKYFDTKVELKRLISEKSSQNLSQAPKMSNNSQSAKMPEIVIEKFTGEQKNWASFYDIFQALVLNNTDLDDVQKLIYLKSSLRGEPLKLIETLSITSTNLKIALDALKDRYQNKLASIYAHIKALVEMPSISKNNQNGLREFILAIKQNRDSLRNLQVPIDQWDLILVYILSQKLDFNTRRAYELERGPTALPTFANFLEFLEKRCVASENLSSPELKRKTIHFTTSGSSNRADHPSHKTQNNCAYCRKSDHNIFKCTKFRDLSVSQRKQHIFNKRLCFKCFSPHSVNQCSWKNCPMCGLPHNSLLHIQNNGGNSINKNSGSSGQHAREVKHNSNRENHQNRDGSGSSNQTVQPSDKNKLIDNSDVEAHEEIVQVGHLSTSVASQHVLIATAKILVKADQGRLVTARVVLDNGSQVSLVTSKFLRKINLQPYFKNVQISGVSGKSSLCNQMIDLQIISRIDPNKCFTIQCTVMDKITCPLPQISLNYDKFDIPKTMILADPEFCVPSDVDMLLGSDVYYEVSEPGLLKLGDGLPVLQNSCFGWVVGGSVSENCVSFLGTAERVSLFNSTLEISNQLQKFWSLEEVSNDVTLSDDEAVAEQLFKDTTKILENGRFQVNIPLKTPNEYTKLGESYSQAVKRFCSLEKKLHRDKKLFQDYKEFIDEYVALNHARYVPLSLKNANGDNKYFIPHHCVIREDKTTTRLRVVFDASSKSSSGYSLNDITLKGYQTQPDLMDILMRFRSFEYVLVVDIKKMFRQVVINPSQSYLQNILWRERPDEDLKCVELLVLSYGVNFAPFVSTRCLLELANSHETEFPLAANALRQQCYMDDILAGTDNSGALVELGEQLIALLNIAKFELHKWNSNSRDFLEHFGDEGNSTSYDIVSDDHSSKILGISWCSTNDYFTISLPKNIKVDPATKRNILSVISRIYDPLGFVSPVTVVGKMLMQKIWLSKLTWDQILDERLKLEWLSFVKNLSELSKQRVPRCFLIKSDLIRVELHGFADASLRAYGACVYIRGLYGNKSVSSHLVCSKSRIAPVRTVSLPRLELCACLLLGNLIHRVLDILKNITFATINLWTDSEISLCWIKSHPSKWNIFVSNRVARIQELSSGCTWRHIRSKDNPADHLSRGLTSSELLNCAQWWTGPQFLSQFDFVLSCHQSEDKSTDLKNIPEQRKTVLTVNEINYSAKNTFQRFSCFVRMQRVIAVCIRFCKNSRKNSEKIYGPLEVQELQNSFNAIIKSLQEIHFSTEIDILKNGKLIKNKSILSLTPFLDSSGILRVGGRLSNADIPYSQKYPILLPANDHVVTLLLRREHLRLYHAGPQTVLSNFRLRFWPLNGLRQIKRIVKNCVVCCRFKAQVATQIMADLPSDRVNITYPFQKTGLDFGGPFTLKSSNLRKAPTTKAYIAIFICMVTKCVHIELVSSLSTEAFLHTLRRFIARRGNPSIIYSDNATNFLGARNQLKELNDFFKRGKNLNSIKEFLSSNEVQWKFIPPRSPHWGGIWEAAIKSTKYHISRVVGNTHLTFEEFSSVLACIESILNSRPLTALSDDPSDLTVLTPGHFLIGRSLTAYPEKDLTTVADNRLTVWQKCIKMQQSFWSRWSVEYLNQLQNKPKWMFPNENLIVNQVVLLKEDNSPPLKWPLARITEVIPGPDGKVRLVRVRSGDGSFTRSISKICPLPCNHDFKNVNIVVNNVNPTL